MFAYGSGDQGSIPGRVILKTQSMVLDATLLNTQLYEVMIKVEHSREHLGIVAIEKGAFGSTSTKVANFTYFYFIKSKTMCKEEMYMWVSFE